MSYILDALQRADAERTRGGIPTLQAQPLASPGQKTGLGPRQRLGLIVAAAGLLGAAAAVWWTSGTPQASIATQAPPPLSASAPALPVAPLVPLAVQPAPIASSIAAVTIAVAPPKSPASGTKAAVVAAPHAVAVAPGPSLAPLLSELPDATRRQIPAMAITGAVYSDNPAQRLLLVNGLVLNQGSEVAADVTLVEIRSNSSEFSFKGTRFRMAH